MTTERLLHYHNHSLQKAAIAAYYTLWLGWYGIQDIEAARLLKTSIP